MSRGLVKYQRKLSCHRLCMKNGSETKSNGGHRSTQRGWQGFKFPLKFHSPILAFLLGDNVRTIKLDSRLFFFFCSRVRPSTVNLVSKTGHDKQEIPNTGQRVGRSFSPDNTAFGLVPFLSNVLHVLIFALYRRDFIAWYKLENSHRPQEFHNYLFFVRLRLQSLIK